MWDIQKHCRLALEGSWVSVPNWDRGARIQVEMITRGIRGWLSAVPSLENSLSVAFTGHCSLSPGLAGGRPCAGWMVCGPLSSTPFPSPSRPPVPCPLSYHRDPASWEQVFMQNPLTFQSCFHSLHSHRTQTAHRGQSGHCRSTWSLWHCSHLLL